MTHGEIREAVGAFDDKDKREKIARDTLEKYGAKHIHVHDIK